MVRPDSDAPNGSDPGQPTHWTGPAVGGTPNHPAFRVGGRRVMKVALVESGS